MNRIIALIFLALLGFCVEGHTAPSEEIKIQQMMDLAKKGDVKDQFALGAVYYDAEEYYEAFRWINKSADQGYEPAIHRRALMYFYGKGVSNDSQKATEELLPIATAGNAWAQRILGLKYSGHRSWGATSDVEAVRWFQLSAAQGDGWSLRELGKCYYEGKGISKDIAKGIAYMTLAEIVLEDKQWVEGHLSSDLRGRDYNRYTRTYDYEEKIKWDNISDANELAKQYMRDIFPQTAHKSLVIKIDSITTGLRSKQSEFRLERKREERWAWVGSVFEVIGDVFSGLLEIGFIGFALGVVILIFLGGLVYWIFLTLRAITIGISGFVKALFHGIVRLIEIPYQLLFDNPAKNRKIKELETEVLILKDEADALNKKQNLALSMPAEEGDEPMDNDYLEDGDEPMDNDYLEDGSAPSPFDPDDWGHGAINPSHDPGENPWIDVFGEGDEADAAYWNTD